MNNISGRSKVFRAGDRVRHKSSGATGRVIRPPIAVVMGVVLDRPVVIVRRDEPDADGIWTMTASKDELEAEAI